MEFDREMQLALEAEMKKRVERTKAKIRKYPKNVQDEIEAVMIANIVYNSEAIEDDTLPEEQAIALLSDKARKEESISIFA